jgi:hypothetical protein
VGTIWIKEFTGGLDTRRMAETTSGGVLIRATDGHITRGGEFEKRAAFVKEYTLPEGETVGLAAGKTGIYVFGDEAPPTLPSGVSYQRLQHLDGTTALTAVPSYDLYAGKIYAVGEFADGSRYHFYDAVRVPSWYDGRARAQFRVVSGAGITAASATGSFEVTGGTLSAGVNRTTSIKIDGVEILNTAVDHTGNNATTASAIAAQITSYNSSPEYTASAVGQTVTITASATGTAANGKTIVITNGGNVTTANVVNMSGGVAAESATLSSLTVDGVEILSGATTWTTSNSNTAALIAASINSASSTPEYSATAVDEVVNIVADSAGTSANDRVVAFTTTAGFTVSPDTGLAMAGGSDPTPATSASGSFTITGGTAGASNKISAITINGTAIISGDVLWTTSHTDTATAVKNAINSYVSSPDYTATSDGAVVTVTAVSTGPAVNGQSIVVTVGGNVTVGSPQAMSGGADAEATFVPGTFVRTIGSRMHSVSGANEHFSGIAQPTSFTTDTTGAGFIDMSTQTSGAETLYALAEYQNYVAVFAERVIIVYYFDSDPTLNAKKQTLKNTGTASPLSVTEFGDNDLFYLDESGCRSLRARDASNSAATTDIGVPVDTLIVAKLKSLSADERKAVTGLINPEDGRFWLIMKDTIFVFSFFGGAKISAWSTYTPSYYNEDGDLVTFDVDGACVYRRRVYLRSGDDIFVYGGLDDETVYDDTEAEAWPPLLDANSPTRHKQLSGIDAAVEGLWEVRVNLQPTNPDASDIVARVSETTYNLAKMDATGVSTHFGLRFKSKGAGRAKLGAAVVHFVGGSDED